MRNQMLFPLSQLPEGERAYIHTLHLTGGIRRRLQDLGFVPGTRVVCLQRALAGNPIAYQIRGAVIALREQDAAQLDVLREPEPTQLDELTDQNPLDRFAQAAGADRIPEESSRTTEMGEMGEESCVKAHP